MAKRIKSDVEKQYITRMWDARKKYLEYKSVYESVCGSYMDGELMHKAKVRYDKLWRLLQDEWYRARRMAA